MKLKNNLMALLLIGAVAGACVPKEDDGLVLVKVENPTENGAKWVGLQVINDRIIRVRATHEEAFPQKKPSLMIVPQQEKPDYTVSEEGGKVRVIAKGVTAVVDKSNGRVEFYDAEGNALLKETTENGKTFEPFYVPDNEIGVGALTEEQRNGWTWHAQFDSPDDEAFYGLGQHQSEEYNMKGKNEDLFQYNTKVSVPFVMSNKNYGLLWDSYSYCRWGNPNDYLQLHRAFTLYDKEGNPGHLTGTYTDAKGKTLVQAEDSLYYEHAFTVTN
ncbi:MAG: DUF4968 domain-containing protein, partial [Bacteroidaceae bacterium]|nr:DUF4968 domain-containing protein [Bacteroidaceae bacterium]